MPRFVVVDRKNLITYSMILKFWLFSFPEISHILRQRVSGNSSLLSYLQIIKFHCIEISMLIIKTTANIKTHKLTVKLDQTFDTILHFIWIVCFESIQNSYSKDTSINNTIFRSIIGEINTLLSQWFLGIVFFWFFFELRCGLLKVFGTVQVYFHIYNVSTFIALKHQCWTKYKQYESTFSGVHPKCTVNQICGAFRDLVLFV